MPLTDHVTPPSPCPWCGYRADRATGVDPGDDTPPSPGDFTVCFNCASVCRFDMLLNLVRCAESEWQELPEPDPSLIRAARRAIIEYHYSQPKGADR